MPRIIFLVRGVDEIVDLLLVGDEGEEPAAVRCYSVTVVGPTDAWTAREVVQRCMPAW